MDNLTCIHQSHGLCRRCQRDFDEDPVAWLEFGNHPEGLANLAALEAELAAEAAAYRREEELRQGQDDWPAPADEAELPF
jgi:hypothetical protein